MKYFIVILSLLILASANIAQAKELDSKDLIKQKAENIKKDSAAIKQALTKELNASAKVIDKEADKIIDQVEELKADFKKHGEVVSASRKQISKELEEKVEELEDLVDSLN